MMTAGQHRKSSSRAALGCSIATIVKAHVCAVPVLHRDHSHGTTKAPPKLQKPLFYGAETHSREACKHAPARSRSGTGGGSEIEWCARAEGESNARHSKRPTRHACEDCFDGALLRWQTHRARRSTRRWKPQQEAHGRPFPRAQWA